MTTAVALQLAKLRSLLMSLPGRLAHALARADEWRARWLLTDELEVTVEEMQ